MIKLVYILVLLTLTVPTQLLSFKYFGLNFDLNRVLRLLLVLVSFSFLSLEHFANKNKKSFTIKFFLLLILTLFMSISLPAKHNIIFGLFYPLYYFSIFFPFSYKKNNPDLFALIIKTALVFNFIVCVIQILNNDSIFFEYTEELKRKLTRYNTMRALGIFGDPLTCACFGTYSLLYFLCFYSKKNVIWIWLSFLLVLLTLSQALILTCVVLIFYYYSKYFKLANFTSQIILIPASILSLGLLSIFISNFESGSMTIKIVSNVIGFAPLALAAGISGFGFGAYQIYGEAAEILHNNYIITGNVYFDYNFFTFILYEGGCIYLISFFALFIHKTHIDDRKRKMFFFGIFMLCFAQSGFHHVCYLHFALMGLESGMALEQIRNLTSKITK